MGVIHVYNAPLMGLVATLTMSNSQKIQNDPSASRTKHVSALRVNPYKLDRVGVVAYRPPPNFRVSPPTQALSPFTTCNSWHHTQFSPYIYLDRCGSGACQEIWSFIMDATHRGLTCLWFFPHPRGYKSVCHTIFWWSTPFNYMPQQF